MAEITRYIKHRRDTAANWTSNNPILKAGQLGIETDDLTSSPKLKIGDGSTAWASLPYVIGILYNVLNYGLKGDGSTNNSAALTTMLTALPTGSTVYFPQGTYNFGSQITITDKYFNFTGDFPEIHATGNFSIFKMTSTSVVTQLAGKTHFNNITFSGTSSGTSQGALIFYQDASQFDVNNCHFYDFGGAAIITYIINSSTGSGGLIKGCRFISNNIGIDGQLAGEYVQIIGCYFLDCTQAIQSIAGNWIVSGNNIIRCVDGIKWSAGSNDGHGIISDNNINHMNNYGIYLYGLNNGMTLSDNHSYSCNWYIANCIGVNVSGGKLDVGTYTLTNNTGLVFNNVNFIGSTGTNNLTGTAPVYVNCKNLNGDTCAGTTSALVQTGQKRKTNFTLISSSTLQTFASTLTYYLSPTYSIVGSRSIANQITYKIGKRCKLIGYSINTVHNGTSPTQTAATVYLRLNNTTDVTLNTGVLWNATAWTTNTYSDFTLNQDILSTDSWELKIVMPTLATAPNTAILHVTLHFSEDF